MLPFRRHAFTQICRPCPVAKWDSRSVVNLDIFNQRSYSPCRLSFLKNTNFTMYHGLIAKVTGPPRKHSLRKLLYVSFYDSTASTWTLAAPRSTWKSKLFMFVVLKSMHGMIASQEYVDLIWCRNHWHICITPHSNEHLLHPCCVARCKTTERTMLVLWYTAMLLFSKGNQNIFGILVPQKYVSPILKMN